MTTPQSAIFVEGHRCLHALEYTINPTTTPDAIVDALKATLNVANTAVAEVLLAFGPQMWARLSRDRMPSGFTDFQPLHGPKAQAPATQRDIFVWLHAPNRDQVFDAVLAIDEKLSQIATRSLDQPGFMYHDSRDLTGFVDGSANPKDDEAKNAAALVPEGEPGAGGAIVMSQKWVHNLAKFNAQDVHEQERVIGRTKADSIELEGDAQPKDSHVSRTDLKVHDVAQKMYRRSFPYGSASEHGLYFLAFACEQARFDNVLASMYGLSEDATTDHLLDFSTPITGSYWFAPSQDDLKAVIA